eukprot:TRINITY_DN22256_c0_g1_i1.p1 TRINITY_DN22256_c0_g1~~TRINITY_DN22256_c0_g1_i1.p1  ORF type:complete len:711 (-),score=173.57 TRINITY_DN22256_c0_g1_i1:51-2060(-)
MSDVYRMGGGPSAGMAMPINVPLNMPLSMPNPITTHVIAHPAPVIAPPTGPMNFNIPIPTSNPPAIRNSGHVGIITPTLKPVVTSSTLSAPTPPIVPVTAPPTQAPSAASEVVCDSDSDSLSDSGADNPRDIDYFMADGFLQEEVNVAPDNDFDNEENFEVMMEKRKKKLEQLRSLYRSQVIRLKDILETKHRKFLKMQSNHLKKFVRLTETNKSRYLKSISKMPGNYHNLRKARSAVLEQSDFLIRLRQDSGLSSVTTTNTFTHSGHNPETAEHIEAIEKGRETDSFRTCTYPSCDQKVLPLSSYCYAHILNDKNQVLFRQCLYVSPGGIRCDYPVMKNSVPQACSAHTEFVKVEPEPVSNPPITVHTQPPPNTQSNRPNQMQQHQQMMQYQIMQQQQMMQYQQHLQMMNQRMFLPYTPHMLTSHYLQPNVQQQMQHFQMQQLQHNQNPNNPQTQLNQSQNVPTPQPATTQAQPQTQPPNTQPNLSQSQSAVPQQPPVNPQQPIMVHPNQPANTPQTMNMPSNQKLPQNYPLQQYQLFQQMRTGSTPQPGQNIPPLNPQAQAFMLQQMQMKQPQQFPYYYTQFQNTNQPGAQNSKSQVSHASQQAHVQAQMQMMGHIPPASTNPPPQPQNLNQPIQVHSFPQTQPPQNSNLTPQPPQNQNTPTNPPST